MRAAAPSPVEGDGDEEKGADRGLAYAVEEEANAYDELADENGEVRVQIKDTQHGRKSV